MFLETSPAEATRPFIAAAGSTRGISHRFVFASVYTDARGDGKPPEFQGIAGGGGASHGIRSNSRPAFHIAARMLVASA